MKKLVISSVATVVAVAIIGLLMLALKLSQPDAPDVFSAWSTTWLEWNTAHPIRMNTPVRTSTAVK